MDTPNFNGPVTTADSQNRMVVQIGSLKKKKRKIAQKLVKNCAK